jgi:uncharacterized protein YqjF (DUF2071 family)
MHAPDRPWLQNQYWENVLFIHFPVEISAIAAVLPQGLEPDSFEDSGWVSLVLFRCVENRLNILGGMRLLPDYMECNCRTYVKHRGVAGIHFMQLAVKEISVLLATRLLTKMPYALANTGTTAHGWRGYCCEGKNGNIYARYLQSEPITHPNVKDLWLTERYHAFQQGSNGTLYRYDICHKPWELMKLNTSVLDICYSIKGITFKTCPGIFLHFSTGVDALLWPRCPVVPK